MALMRARPRLGLAEATGWTGAQWYLLLLFMAIHIMLGVDRAILSVVAEPLKHEFSLTDTHLGILIGVGFSVFYSVAGVFLGWAVDHLNRRTVLSVCVAVFGMATAAAAWSTSFAHLLLSRLLVGAGEAGGGPAMVSMIADRFPQKRRGLAMSIFYMGAPLGLLFTFLIGGYIAATYGWRTTFVVAGVPAVVLAILAAFTVRDSDRQATAVIKGMPFRTAIRHIFAQRTARTILMSVVCYTAALTALVAFLASFLIRSHGMALQDAAGLLALSFGIMGTIGAPLSGYIVDLLARRDIRWRSWWVAVVLLASVVLAGAALLSPTLFGAVALFVIWGLFSNAMSGPAMATFQSVITVEARGVSTSIYYLVAHLIGSTGGALAVGLLSDALKPGLGQDSLRYALLAVLSLQLVASVLWLLSARTVKADIATAEAMNGTPA